MQFFGRQFDDDTNTRVVPSGTLQNADYHVASGCSGITGCEPGLPGYSTADIFVSRDIGRNINVFFGIENMLDQTYFVGTQPTTIGSPRLVTEGIQSQVDGTLASGESGPAAPLPRHPQRSPVRVEAAASTIADRSQMGWRASCWT
jgi:outer membrane receptor protein involved in Fe transport